MTTTTQPHTDCTDDFGFAEAFVALKWESAQWDVAQQLAKHTLFQESFRQHGVNTQVTPEQRSALLMAFRQKTGTQAPEAFEQFCQQSVQTPAMVEAALVYQELITRLQHKVISPMAVDAVCRLHPAAQERYTFGLLRVPNEAMAIELYHRLSDDGLDFMTMAAQYSSGTEAPSGGLVGPVPIRELNPAVQQALRELAVLAVSPPLQLDESTWALVRLYRADTPIITEDIIEQCRRSLFEDWIGRQLAQISADDSPQDGLS